MTDLAYDRSRPEGWDTQMRLQYAAIAKRKRRAAKARRDRELTLLGRHNTEEHWRTWEIHRRNGWSFIIQRKPGGWVKL